MTYNEYISGMTFLTESVRKSLMLKNDQPITDISRAVIRTSIKLKCEELVNKADKALFNPYIDRYGNPYDSDDKNACWPAGGGLHKDCEFNADALYAYYIMASREKISTYLIDKGFIPLCESTDYEEWKKGNTLIVFESHDNGADLWGYMHTELLDENGVVAR